MPRVETQSSAATVGVQSPATSCQHSGVRPRMGGIVPTLVLAALVLLSRSGAVSADGATQSFAPPPIGSPTGTMGSAGIGPILVMPNNASSLVRLPPTMPTVNSVVVSPQACEFDACQVIDGAPAVDPPRRWYAGWEFLYWWTRGPSVPVLLTTSPLGTPAANAGVLGDPATTVAFGGDALRDQGMPGGRFRLGRLMDVEGRNLWEAEFLQLAGDVDQYRFQSPGEFDILARPFFNTQTSTQDAVLVGFPGIATGSFDARVTSDLHGWGTWWRTNFVRGLGGDPCLGNMPQPTMCGGTWLRGDFLVGYRNLDLDESLRLREQRVSTDPGGPVPVGTTFNIQDRFRTENEFHGLDLGIRGEWLHQRWGLSPGIKFAMGSLRQQLTIAGTTTVAQPGGPAVTTDGGLLALASNSGAFERDVFTVVPEIGLNGFWHVSDCMRLVAGYTLIVIPSVLRPGDVIDLNIDPQQLPPPTAAGTSPMVVVREDDLWVQGVSFGVEVRF